MTMLQTIIFSSLLFIGCSAFLLQLRTMFADNDPFARRIRLASDMRSAVEIAGDVALEAQRRRDAPGFMKVVVERLKLTRWLGTEGLRERLNKAGYRFRGAEVIYLFARFACPILLLSVAAFYVYVLNLIETETTSEALIAILAIFAGLQIPDQFLKRRAAARLSAIADAWPDSLDLMQIAVESGMTIDGGIRYVAEKLEDSCEPLSDELMLLLSHFSVMPDRRSALIAFAERVDLESVRNFSTVLIQAERSGTAIGKALRTLSSESRRTRMRLAEKKAAQLGPKLTVPLILCFVPVLLAIILMPGIITYING